MNVYHKPQLLRRTMRLRFVGSLLRGPLPPTAVAEQAEGAKTQ